MPNIECLRVADKEENVATKPTNVKNTSQVRPTMASILGNVNTFKRGSRWETFEDQLEAFILLNDISEVKKSGAVDHAAGTGRT